MAPPTSPSTSLIGKAKELEVAGTLISHGLYVFYPLVDVGFDLVATNRRGTTFIPVQVKYRARDPALNLLPKDIKNLQGTRAVVAWAIASKKSTWFIPFADWHAKAEDPGRADGMRYITISQQRDWLASYEGAAGVRTAFAALFDRSAA